LPRQHPRLQRAQKNRQHKADDRDDHQANIHRFDAQGLPSVSDHIAKAAIDADLVEKMRGVAEKFEREVNKRRTKTSNLDTNLDDKE